MTVAAILVADAAPHNGFSQPLALLPWRDDDTLIEYHVAQIEAAGVDAVEVVLGYEAEEIIPLVARGDVEPIVNPRWPEGIAGSLRTGATAVPRGIDPAIILTVAQPRPADVYRALLDAHLASGAAITRPSYDGILGTPVVVNGEVLAELRNLATGDLETVVASHADNVHDLMFDTDIVLLEITRQDYDRARSLLHET